MPGTRTRDGADGAPRLRADGRRNRELIVRAASRLVAEHGAGASLEEIARQAGVGSATLHRHFPSRRLLLEAVLFEQVTRLCSEAEQLAAALPPRDALVQWLELLTRHGVTTRGLTAAYLHASGDGQVAGARSATCEQLLVDAGQPLLSAAQREGHVRDDIGSFDVLTVVFGLCVAVEQHAAPVDDAIRLLHLSLEGIMRRPGPSHPA